MQKIRFNEEQDKEVKILPGLKFPQLFVKEKLEFNVRKTLLFYLVDKYSYFSYIFKYMYFYPYNVGSQILALVW